MSIFIYLLKLVTCSALFYAYYFFALRNKNMHQYNRFYILFSLLLAIILPLIKLPLLTSVSEQQAITLQGIAFGGWEKEIVITANQSVLNSAITEHTIVAVIYVTGVLLTIYPVVTSLAYLRKLSRSHQAKDLGSIRFYDTTAPGTPFSFFNSVFWNSKIPLDTEEGQQILRHELYHIKQKHSYDMVFMQLASSLLWFNPFFYLLNKELKIVHEFLADEYAATGTDRHHYAEVLVMQAVSSQQVFITNQFFYNQIKRRIAMILQSKSTRYGNARKAMSVPIALLIFCACSVKNKDEEKLQLATDAQKTEATGKSNKDFVAPPVSGDAEFQAAGTNSDPILEKLEIESSFPGGSEAWMTYLNKKFRYPMEAQEKEIQGTVVIQFIVDKFGNVSDVHAIKGPNQGGLKEEGMRVIKESGKWLPGIQNGKKVNSYKRQVITFKLERD